MNFVKIIREVAQTKFTSITLGKIFQTQPFLRRSELFLTKLIQFLSVHIYSPINHLHHSMLENVSLEPIALNISMHNGNSIINTNTQIFHHVSPNWGCSNRSEGLEIFHINQNQSIWEIYVEVPELLLLKWKYPGPSIWI